MAEKIVKVGLVGFGTVGSGVAKIILENNDEIAVRTGLRLELVCVVDKDTTTPRAVTLPAGILTGDVNRLLNDNSIDIAIELVGGTTFAKDLQIKMLQSGKHVVTANKALLAKYGTELRKVAAENNKCIAFEASCAGGIPIISAIRTSLAANNIEAMYGIVNGTCNYILSNMTVKNEDFATALKQAQKKGYAEADPTLDINGGDSAHKLIILSSLAFGYELKLEDVYVEGIDGIAKDDINYGGEMGYILKLLAIGQKDPDGKVSLKVKPSFIAKDNPLAKVDGSFNAVSVFGSAVGQLTFYGRGAGMMPTASAVVADVIEVGLGNSERSFRATSLKPREQVLPLIKEIGNTVSRFYIRMMVKDEPGGLARYSQVLAKHNISISGVLQREGSGPDNTVPIVITTHRTRQQQITAAMEDMKGLDVVSGKPVCISIVDMPEDTD
ncbi:MAG TPA: homoserine dehydrogenase [Sedimentisphaerales bacterium]|nr:homoserine dehydrogenase [Sedimentisphaerales bacterium]